MRFGGTDADCRVRRDEVELGHGGPHSARSKRLLRTARPFPTSVHEPISSQGDRLMRWTHSPGRAGNSW